MRFPIKKIYTVYLFSIFLMIDEFVLHMSNDIYLPALPKIAFDFHTTINYIQLTITIWLVGAASFQWILGPLSDKYGRRPIMFLGLLIFLLSTIACALSTYLWILFVGRFFQGVAVSCFMIASYASVNELFDDHTALHIIAWLSIMQVLAPIIGPIVGGVILHFYSWGSIFWSLAISVIIGSVGLWLCMPESNVKAQESLHPIEVGRSYLNILRNKQFIITAMPTILLYSGIILWITASAFILIDLYHVEPNYFGIVQLPIFISYIIGSTILKGFIKKVTAEHLAIFGLSISSISALLLLFFVKLGDLSLSTIIILISLYTFGCGFANAPLTRLTLTSSTERMGITTAVFYMKLASLGALVSFIISMVQQSSLIPFAIILAFIILSAWLMNYFRHLFFNTTQW